MKSIITLLLCFTLIVSSKAQNRVVDSLNQLIKQSTSDTQRINLKIEKLKALSSINLDSTIAFGNALLNECRQINYKTGEAKIRIKLAGDYCFTGDFEAAKNNLDIVKNSLLSARDSLMLGKMLNKYGMMYSMQNQFDTSHSFYNKAISIISLQYDKSLLSSIYQNNAIAYQQESNYPKALFNYQQALRASEEINDEEGSAYIYLNLGITYNALEETKKAEDFFLKSIGLAKKLNIKNVLTYAYANLSSLYYDMGKYDKQYDFALKAAKLAKETGDKGIEASSLARAGLGLARLNDFNNAEKLLRQSMVVADLSHQPYNIYQAYTTMGQIFSEQKKYKEAIPYYEQGFRSLSTSDIYTYEVGNNYFRLSECYEKTGNYSNALSSFKMSAEILDSIRGKDNIKKATELSMNYEFDKKQELAKAEQRKKDEVSKTKQTALIVGLLLMLILAIVSYKGFRNKRRSNLLLQKQKEEIQNALKELKSTQAQLIQSEKMASLGELTAGIAHEIQNPLNFVNNFSEVSTELIDEMKEELSKANYAEANEIANDLKENLEKINHHGKRAGDIVKGMLQHSRSSSGVKEPTDINALADEYLRLSYHGLRAKNKSFNAKLVTDFDESMGKINIIPQDIGRVLLNLFNNAFYAVSEQKSKNLISYEPTVSLRTKKTDNHVIITISDNGSGIPQNIVAKIFQPFFTTKPTGRGTGLGLSLSYDILKAHGGEIKVESKENEGTTFIIQLPFA